MSISQSLSNALTGLNANSRMAEVISANLSNALTEGYGRRALEMSAQSIGSQSGGVRVDGVVRMSDRGLLGERRLADAGLAGADRNAAVLKQLETAFSAADDPAGLGARMTAFETALAGAATDPSSDQRLGLVVSRLGDVTDRLSTASRTVQNMRVTADANIARDVETLNTALKQVQQLNEDIGRLGGRSIDPSALIDQRQRAIDAIGSIVPIREISQSNGQVSLWTSGGLSLLDGKAVEIGFSPASVITPDMTLTSGGLRGLTINGVSAGPDGVGRLGGGSLGSTFALRDGMLVQAQAGLDEVAADLISRFADPAVDPTLIAGDPGLLTDAGTAHNPADLVGLSQRIAVNASVDPKQGGLLSRLRDGVQASATGPVGNPDQLNRFADALAARRSINPGIAQSSAAGQIARVANLFATQRLQADEQKSFATARRDTLQQAELATGVDSDFELQSLLRVEQAYAANAKVVETIQALMQRLMDI